MTSGMPPRLKMVADENRVEPDLFSQTGEVEKLIRAELFGRRLVSKFQQQPLL